MMFTGMPHLPRLNGAFLWGHPFRRARSTAMFPSR